MLRTFCIIVIIIVVLKVRCMNCFDVVQWKNNTFFEQIYKLKEELGDFTTSNLKISITDLSPKCVQIECKFVCFNGRSDEISNDIKKIATNSSHHCDTLGELRLYNYYFSNNRISRGFLGEYSNRVESLYIASSDVYDIDGGALANGIFRSIFFEELRLEEMRKDFFESISLGFHSLTIIQRNKRLTVISNNFLDHVKYQIKYLTIQVGIECIRNLTAANNLLNNLGYVDFSHNNFGGNYFTTSTFSKLSMVEHMDLSHSNISYLPEYLFADFTNTLAYLDLSYNHLKIIFRTVFGWRDLPRDLKIIANNNEWECSCGTYYEMKSIFVYHQSNGLFCTTPDEYSNWSVFDNRLCESSAGASTTNTAVVTTLMDIAATDTVCSNCAYTVPENLNATATDLENKYTMTKMTTPHVEDSKVPPFLSSNNVQLECQATRNYKKNSQFLQWPTLSFSVHSRPSLSADIIIDSKGLNESFGILWFSKVSTEMEKMVLADKMETNYNEYGLGCSISHRTTIDNLIPDVAYTFCLVLKEQYTVSPFSCKSIYVVGNIEVTYSSWLTRDMAPMGISLTILGIVLFTFVGILVVFLVIKQRPMLLIGSKRVGTTKGNSNNIIVFPKDNTINDFQQKERIIRKYSSRSDFSCVNRRDSIDSIESTQSYMNTNLYEVLPEYLKFNECNTKHSRNCLAINAIHIDEPFANYYCGSNLDSYAEIPNRTKRISNDPLPEVPIDQAPLSLSLSKSSPRISFDVNHALSFESQI